MKRVVVTGIGAVTPLGNSFPGSFGALLEGRGGTAFSSAGPYAVGELKGFDSSRYFSEKERRKLDPFIQYAYAASAEAVEEAALGAGGLRGAAVFLGSGRGGIASLSRAFSSGKRISPYLMPSTTIAMAAGFVSSRLGAGGEAQGFSNSCTSGTTAIGEAMRYIRHGYGRVALAGGCEAPLAPGVIEGYGATRALSKTGLARPFDLRRDGFLLAEGAAVMVLEEKESALGRGAHIIAELGGFGARAGGLEGGQTAPDMAGQRGAIEAALADADITGEEISAIVAHATGTRLGDRTEAGCIENIFESIPPVVAIKGATGHMIGASGAFEAAVASACLRGGVLPPSLNHEEPEFDLPVTTRRREAGGLRAVLCNSFGFGGVNAALVFLAPPL